MKQFKAFASKLRIHTLLCCGAAALLTACGGNIDTGSEPLSATAAGVSTDAGSAAPASTVAAAPAFEASAEATPAASAEAVATASTEATATVSTGAAPITDQATGASTQAFELTGYDSNPLQAQSGQQDPSIKH